MANRLEVIRNEYNQENSHQNPCSNNQPDMNDMKQPQPTTSPKSPPSPLTTKGGGRGQGRLRINSADGGRRLTHSIGTPYTESSTWHSTPASKLKKVKPGIALVEPTFYEESANASFSKKSDSRMKVLPPASPARMPAISRFRQQPWMRHGAHSVTFKRYQPRTERQSNASMVASPLNFDDESDDEIAQITGAARLQIGSGIPDFSTDSTPLDCMTSDDPEPSNDRGAPSPEDQEIQGIFSPRDSVLPDGSTLINSPPWQDLTQMIKPQLKLSLYRHNVTPASIAANPQINVISPTRSNQPSPNLIGQSFYRPEQRTSYFQQMFTVIRRLGQGSFGEVFQVKPKHQCNSSRELGACAEYAVKKSIQPFISSKDRERKFQEVRQHQSLPPHPNCVMFIQAWEEDGFLFIQQELCERTLDQDMIMNYSNSQMPEPRCMDYLLDLLNGLVHLHNHHFMHLDIKPANIFLGKDGRLKIGDFGLVSKEASPDGAGSPETLDNERQEGDPRYMAQELLDGKFTCKADIFSLGVVILEIATGLDPPQYGALWHRLRSGGGIPHEFSCQISTELHRLIILMLRDWDDRPSAQELLQMQSLACRAARDNLSYSESGSKSFAAEHPSAMIERYSFEAKKRQQSVALLDVSAMVIHTTKAGTQILIMLVVNCILFVIKCMLKIVPAEILVKNNIQLLTPTSKCIGTCQKKLMKRLGRSTSAFRLSAMQEQSSAGSYAQASYGPVFSDDEHDISPLANGSGNVASPRQWNRAQMTPPQLRKQSAVPSSAPVLRHRSRRSEMQTPESNGAVGVGPNPYIPGQTVRAGMDMEMLQKMGGNGTSADSPIAEYIRQNTEESHQKLVFDSSSDDERPLPSQQLRRQTLLTANVKPNNHLAVSPIQIRRHNSGPHSRSRNSSSRSPQPSPLSKHSQPACPPNSAANPERPSKQLQLNNPRRYRPLTPQTPELKTPQKIRGFQSRLRRFRPDNAADGAEASQE